MSRVTWKELATDLGEGYALEGALADIKKGLSDPNLTDQEAEAELEKLVNLNANGQFSGIISSPTVQNLLSKIVGAASTALGIYSNASDPWCYACNGHNTNLNFTGPDGKPINFSLGDGNTTINCNGEITGITSDDGDFNTSFFSAADKQEANVIIAFELMGADPISFVTSSGITVTIGCSPQGVWVNFSGPMSAFVNAPPLFQIIGPVLAALQGF